MKPISAYLDRFKSITPPHKALKTAFCEALASELGITVDEEKITIRSGILAVKAHPSLKSEIFLRKARLLERVNAFARKEVVRDIR